MQDDATTWLSGGLGTRYEAVWMPVDLVHAATRSTDPGKVATFLNRFLDGPVVCAPADGWYLALTLPTGPKWYKRVDFDGLGDLVEAGEQLVLPNPALTDPSDDEPFWSTPVRPGALSHVLTVVWLLDMGDHALYWRARYGKSWATDCNGDMRRMS